MASKSRLGKGLGALFPTLPGEEPVAEQPAMIAEDSSTPEATADITPAKKATAQQGGFLDCLAGRYRLRHGRF